MNPGQTRMGELPDEGPASGRPDKGPASRQPDEGTLRGAIEALLFVADSPMDLARIAAGVQRPVEEVAAALTAITADLDSRGAGWQLRSSGAGFRLYTRELYASLLESFLLGSQRIKLSAAALETLAVIAYRQPVSRARVAAVRGVNVDGVVRTLLARGLIAELGTDPTTGAAVYGTTDEFLERMGISSVEDLPSLAPLLPELADLDVDHVDAGPAPAGPAPASPTPASQAPAGAAPAGAELARAESPE